MRNVLTCSVRRIEGFAYRAMGSRILTGKIVGSVAHIKSPVVAFKLIGVSEVDCFDHCLRSVNCDVRWGYKSSPSLSHKSWCLGVSRQTSRWVQVVRYAASRHAPFLLPFALPPHTLHAMSVSPGTPTVFHRCHHNTYCGSSVTTMPA